MGASTLLLVLPVLGALAAALVPAGADGRGPLKVAIGAAGATLILTLALALRFDTAGGEQFTTRLPWVPEIGVVFHLGLDGVALALAVLTGLLTLIALMVVPATMTRAERPFLIWFLLLEAAVMGVFAARDWFLFYVFWELALIPMFFLIGIWGGTRRAQAAYSFFMYTLAGSVVMLIGLMAAYVEAVAQGAVHGFEMTVIAEVMRNAPIELQSFVFVCVALGMAVKVPIVPLHGWLPTAHVEAPVPASIMLSGILLKMGGYGLLRLADMVPGAFEIFGAIILALGVLTIVYGAVLAFRQDDLKAMIAYSSVSHMGFVVLGIGSLTEIGLRGAAVQMFSHGLVTAALFLLVGIVYAQTHSRSLIRSTGQARNAPRFSVLLTMTLLASMGLPGLSGFVGEFQVFMGGIERWGLTAALAGIGLILTAAFSLRVFRRMVLMPVPRDSAVLRDLGTLELAAVLPLAALMLILGLFPGLISTLVAADIAAALHP
ncbi:complex I subunit 4 family protein [Roseovarius autotrophicus]|uniref:complex I subunit 4 family protein n=1 Tax=Roseovarius autotrophicus TaxID=2824121 RepID=UPI0019E98335|nr:NADH-quinone oxidoreductase subunit M [Roseovarius autotrophicus]MBE0453610.1 NADH-quinone oxidoreductase subunit M [Roseovarius sp.]